jgi:N-acetylglucosamine kinase-like BadF-type ATPase
MRRMAAPSTAALGIDAGGTATRWALRDAAGSLLAEGEGAPASGLQLLSEDGRAALGTTLGTIAAALPALPRHTLAGVTGLDDSRAAAFEALLRQAFGGSARALGDVELLAHAAPGSIVLYAGTGSIAVALDDAGLPQRAGGRGRVIDDAGGGHWIAREALRAVWRAEDETPGAWRASPLARALFAQLGGSEWQHTRDWVYGHAAGARGELGKLALVVAQAAADDELARALLERAGRELARLAAALTHRLGARPLRLAGRVWELHPAVEQGLRAALPAAATVERFAEPAHHAAARLAPVLAAARR